MARSQNVFRVPNVQIGDAVLPVSFKLSHSGRSVRCAVKGKKPFRIYTAFGKYEAAQRGQFQVAVAATPAAAFAEGVQLFWEAGQ